MKEMLEIQSRLVAPKNQRNEFGNFNYRSLEDILSAAKPILKELGCTVTFSDDLVMLGERIFVKSVCTLKNAEGETETSTSFAELDNHKGMSKEQSTGSASSYARKYAVCSLFAIDDSQDVDSFENAPDAPRHAPTDNIQVLKEFCASMKGTADAADLLDFYTYWSGRITQGKFNGTMNPEHLWQKRQNNKNKTE